MKVEDNQGKIKNWFKKKKESFGYNAHPSLAKKGEINRSILKAKMEIRTNSDSNDNEYNLILGHPEKHHMEKYVFSPHDGSNLQIIKKKTEKPIKKIGSLKHGKLKQKHTGVFASQENISKKFISKNDPYQNALSDKKVIRTASEK